MSYTKKQKRQIAIASLCQSITKSAKIKPVVENQILRAVRRVEMKKGRTS